MRNSKIPPPHKQTNKKLQRLNWKRTHLWLSQSLYIRRASDSPLNTPMAIYNRINFIHIGEYLLCFFSLCISSCPLKGSDLLQNLYLNISLPTMQLLLCIWQLIWHAVMIHRGLLFFLFCFVLFFTLHFIKKLSYHSTIIKHSSLVLWVNKRVKNSLSLSWSLLKWCMGMKWLPICLQCILTVREFFFSWQAGEIKVVQDKRGSAVICQGTKGSPVWESGCSPERAFRSLTH